MIEFRDAIIEDSDGIGLVTGSDHIGYSSVQYTKNSSIKISG
jgi:hypothetical protein